METTNTTQNAQTQWLDTSLIDVPAHFREHTPEALESLVKGIQEHGLLQEVVVVAKPDGRYELVAGKGRLTAIQKLSWQQIRAQVLVGVSELDKALISIAENEEREDVSPIDKALSYNRAMVVGHLTQRELAQRRGMPESAMSQYIALTKLPPDLGKNFSQLKLGLAHMTEILRLPKPEDQVKLAEEASKEGLTSKEVRSRVNKLLKPAGSHAKEEKQAVEDTILDCHFVFDGKEVAVKPRSFRMGKESFDDYLLDIKASLTEFVMGLQAGNYSKPEVTPAAA